MRQDPAASHTLLQYTEVTLASTRSTTSAFRGVVTDRLSTPLRSSASREPNLETMPPETQLTAQTTAGATRLPLMLASHASIDPHAASRAAILADNLRSS